MGKPINSMLWMTETHVIWRHEDYERDVDWVKFLRSQQLSHLVKPFKKFEQDYEEKHGVPFTMSRDVLEQTNGKKYEGAVQDYKYTFHELGCKNASESQKLFSAISSWGQKEVITDFASRDAQNLFDINFVREGKQGGKGFTAGANDNYCFTLHLTARDKKGKPFSKVLEFEVDMDENHPDVQRLKINTSKTPYEIRDAVDAKMKQVKSEMRDFCYKNLWAIIHEIRSSKFYVGEDGRTHRRNEPIKNLRIISE